MKKLFTLLLMLLCSTGLFAQLDVVVGTGTVTNTTTSYPAPYGNYWWGARHQFLIPASEIISAGGYGGNILGLGFNVSAVGGAALSGFEVKIGTTTSTSISSWFSGLTTVFSSTSYSETVGWNMHTFTTPFVWDGTSSIVVETCFNNSAYTTNAVVFQSSTSYASSLEYHNDASGICTNTSTSSNPSQRPNIKFSFAPSAAIDAGISAINSPVPPTGPGLKTVTATIKNFGTTTLTSASIGWSVNGVTQTPMNWTGSLATFATDGPLTLGSFNFPQGLSTIKVWSANPNLSTDGFAGNDTATVTINFQNPLIGTYTIGGTAADFPDVTSAVSAMSVAGVAGHVIFSINPGTYTGQITLGTVPGVSDTSTVTFKSANNDSTSVIIQYAAAAAADNWVVRLNGAQHYTFSKLTFKATGTANGRVFEFMNGASNNVVTNSVLESSTTSTSSSYACIYSTTNTGSNNVIITNNVLKGGYYSIYWYGSSTAKKKRFVASGNIVQDYYYYGIQTYYVDSVYINSNTIMNRSGSGVLYPLYVGYNNGYGEVMKNKVIQNATSSQYGIYILGKLSTSTDYITVANNFVTQSGGTGTAYGIYMSSSNYVNIYHNTVRIAGGSATAGRALYNTGGTNINVVNNAFINVNGGFAYYNGTAAAIVNSDNNDYFSTGAVLAYWGANCSTLVALQTANSKDLLSKNVNVPFVSATDLHTSSIDLWQSGTPLALVTDDIDGQLRSATAPCIGADEYILYNTDAGVVSLVEPLSPCTGVNDVKVSLKNFAITNLSSVTLNWSVNGIAQTPVNYTTTVAPGTEVTVTMGTWNFATNVMYNFKFWTSSPNSGTDQNISNDTLWVDKQNAMTGTYTIGAGTADFSSFNAAYNALKLRGQCGPVVFDVANGTYTEQLDLTPVAGNSAVNTILFKSATNDSTAVILQWESLSTAASHVIKLNGLSNVEFLRMTIKASSTVNGGYAVNFTANSHNIKIHNCIVQVATTTSSSYAPIYAPSSTQNFNCSFQNNVLDGGYYGIYWYSSSTTKKNNFTANHNLIKNAYYYGIYTYYSDSLFISNNEVRFASNSGICYGIYAGYNNGYSLIAKNKVYLSGTSTQYGISSVGKLTTSTTYMDIINNFVTQYGSTSNTVYAIYFSSTNYVNLYNNSVNVTGGSLTAGRAFYQTGGTFHKVVNNIFRNSGGGFAYYIGTPAGINTSDYNSFSTTGNVLAYWNANCSTLVALRTANSKDIYSNDMNPGFESVSDLHIGNAGFDNLGTPLIEVIDDIDGELRHATTPDIGADEFTPPQHDAALAAITRPNSGFCGNASDTLSVTVANFGVLTQASIPVIALITAPGGNYSFSAVAPGPIASGQSVTINMGIMNTMLPGTYTIKAYTLLPNDTIKRINDTLVKVVTIQPTEPLPFYEGFATTTMPSYITHTSMSIYGSGSHTLTSNAIGVNLYSSIPTASARFNKKLGPVTAGDYLTFDYRLINYSGYGATVLNKDSLFFALSSDCGNSFYVVHLVDSFSHVPTTDFTKILIPLTSYIGNEVMFGMQFKWNAGDYYVDVDNIGIGKFPVANLGPDKNVCLGDSIIIDAGSDSLNLYQFTYNWSDLATSTVLATTQTVWVDSAVTLVLKKTNQLGLSAYDTIVVNVTTPTPASFSGLQTAYCVNASPVTLTGTPAGGTFAGNGITASTFTPATAGAGSHTITYSYTDVNSCTSVASSQVLVNALPVVSAGNDTALCIGDSLQLNATSNATTPAFAWSNGPQTASYIVSPLVNTTYTVAVTDGTTNCQASDDVVVTVNSLPVVNLGADQTICGNANVTLNAGSGFSAYLWSNTATTASITIDTVGYGLGTHAIYVDVTDNNTCMNSDTVNVTFVANPVPAITGGVPTMCINHIITIDAGAGWASYLWSDNSVTRTIDLVGSVLGLGSHTFSVTVTDANGCEGTDSITVVVDPCTGIAEAEGGISMMIYPNPNNGNFTLSISGLKQLAKVEILNLLGQTISTEQVSINGAFVKEYDLSGLAKGSYLMKVTTDKSVRTERLIVR